MSFLPRSTSLIPRRLTRRLGRTHALVATLLGTLGAVFGVGVAVRAAAAALMIAEPGWPPGDELMYGPHLVSATSGSEVWFEDRFSAEVLPGVTYHVKVRNPGVSGGTPVPNFSVKLNGVYYATKDSLTNGATEFTKQVPLQAWNKIELWIAPGAGQVSLEIYSQAGTSVPFTSVAPVKEIRPQAGLDTVNASWQVTLPPDAGPTHVLVIDNGALNRSGRVGCCEWGEVKLNGARVFWLDTLHKEQAKVMVPVTLQPGTNTLQVIADSLINGAHMHVRVMHAPAASSPPPADDLEWPPNSDVMYGAHTVSATSGSQVWFEDRFSAKVQSGVQYYVKVRNPSLSGGTAVPNFSVKLNGVYYAAKDSLQSGATEFIKQVPLQTWNKIELWIAAGSGKIDLEIYSEPMPFRTLGPVEEIMPTTSALLTRTWQVTKPADAGPTHLIVIDNGAQDRTGRVGSNEYGKIKLNGAIVFDVDTFHLEQAKAVVPVTLQAGVNTIEASGGNMGLGERFHVRAMYADTAKPKLVITQPAQNAVVSSPSVTFSGTYQDSTWGEVRVGSASSHATIPITGNGGVRSWSTVRPLVEGPNVIKVWAKDGAGNKADTLVRTVILDTQQPTLTVSAPTEGFVTTESSVTVSGNASDANGVTVAANGVNLPVDGAGNYSGSVPLVVGANAITITATDGGGNTRSVVRNVTRNAAAAGVTVVTQGLNPGTAIERDECLTIAAGDDAAYECGDLRLVHALPTTRTMNRARTPTLIYNSRHARPAALIAADVSVAAQHAADSLRVTVRIPNKQPATRNFRWDPDWSGGPSRRIVVPVTASTAGLTTGAYGYTLEVQAVSQGAPVAFGSANDTLVVVDRTTSPFGAGWWLEGLEMLSDVTPSANQKLWIGGDGSTRLYTHHQDSVWLVTPTVDRLDSLIQRGSGATARWYRKLRNGAFVEFNDSGQHIATVNRQGHATTFWHSAALDSIRLAVPAASTARLFYRFTYQQVGGDPPLLSSVAAPSRDGEPRTVTITPRTDRGIERFTDPDQFWVGFKYDEATGRVAGRRNRMNDTTFFGFDAAGLLNHVSLDLRRTNGDTATPIVTTIRPAESQSVVPGDELPLLLDDVNTFVDGPRADANDHTRFWLDRFGAPSRIRNALDEETLIVRDDPRFPMLVTMTRGPSPTFFTVRAEYNGRGLVERQTSEKPLAPLDNSDAVTTYGWLIRWDIVETVTSPTGTVTTMRYFDNGDRKSQQVGPDERRVEFDYNADRQLKSVKLPLTAAEGLEYDGHGNLKAAVTSRGFRTEHIRDGLGRDSLTRTQINVAGTQWQEQWLTYDLVDLVRESRSIGPELSTVAPQRTLLVTNDYDAEGRPLSVSRSSTPDIAGVLTATTQFVYDAAGRKTEEVAPDGKRDAYQYDLAGNLRFWTTRRLHTVEMRYDALNRLERRLTPEVTYADGKTIPADDAVFTYDEAGRIRTANNNHAQVSRGYANGGALTGDTLRTAVFDASAHPPAQKFAKHLYGVRYRYDLDGRRIALIHPATIAFNDDGVVADSVAYKYDVVTGQLEWIQGIHGEFTDRYRHMWDLNGRLDSLESPHPPSEAPHRAEKYAYDDDANMIRRHLHGDNHQLPNGTFTTVFHADTLGHDARGKAISVRTMKDTTRYDYNGLGTVVFSTGWHRLTGEITNETFTADAFANVTQTRVEDSGGPVETTSTYEPRVGWLRNVTRNNVSSFVETNDYDASGSRSRSIRRKVYPTGVSQFTVVNEDIKSYYDAAERLSMIDKRTSSNLPRLPKEHASALDEYRYDALGRRVLVWSRRAGCGTVCPSVIERYVWDGDQILFEIRRNLDPFPGQQTLNDIEADTGKVYRLQFPEEDADSTGAPLPPDTLYDMQAIGRVAYLHGLELDHPLVVDRLEMGSDSAYRKLIRVWPFATWRGEYDNGTLSERCPESVCIDPKWTGAVNTYLEISSIAPGDERMWYGSLLAGMRDAPGHIFKRNRYYDPVAGRFTQEDPIGLAGGLNLYGFANGDPVNFSDPFGLVPGPLVAIGAFIARNWHVISAASALGVKGVRIINEARKIVSSPQMETLRAAAQSGQHAAVRIGQRTISYEPDLQAPGFSWAERGFHLGKQAFSSQAELIKTVLHELHRLGTSSVIGNTAAQQAATAETQAAASFAEKAYSLGRVLGIWK